MWPEGEVELSARDDADIGRAIRVLLREGEVVNVTLFPGLTESFRCSRTCSGVTVSGPEASSQITVTFDGTVLNEVESFP